MGIRRAPWGGVPADAHLEAELQQKGLFPDLHRMAGQADLIVLTCSLTETTRGMVDVALLKACKPGVRIINIARGLLLRLSQPLLHLGLCQWPFKGVLL